MYPEIFAKICSLLQPVADGAPHYIYLPHAEDDRREILRQRPEAFSSVPGTLPRTGRPDSRYKVKIFSSDKGRTLNKYRFEAQKDDDFFRCTWPFLAVCRTLRRRFIEEVFSKHTYVINLLDLETFAYLVATPPLKKEEGQDKKAKDDEAPPLPQLPFREISVFVPAGKGLPPLSLQPFFTLAQQRVSVNLMKQEAEERDPVMMATINLVYDFLINLAREGSTLPLQ